MYTVYEQRSELALLFHHVSPGVQDRIVRLGGKCPYLLSHISSPYSHHYFKCLFIICVWVFYVCAPHVDLVPVEVKKVGQVTWEVE